MEKIKAIVKRADEPYGHMTYVSNTLKNLQKHVGGNIEAVTLGGGLVLLCDEEGRINGKPYNCTIFPTKMALMTFFGDIVIVGADEDEFTDVPISLENWKKFYLEV